MNGDVVFVLPEACCLGRIFSQRSQAWTGSTTVSLSGSSDSLDACISVRQVKSRQSLTAFAQQHATVLGQRVAEIE